MGGIMFKCDNVQVAIWIAIAVLEYDAFVNGEYIYFKQSIINKKAQELCNNKVASARIGQWFNGDHPKNTYNFLRAKGSQRRLTAFGEFNGIKEVPEELSRYYKDKIIVGSRAFVVSNHWYGPNKSMKDNRTPFMEWVLDKMK